MTYSLAGWLALFADTDAVLVRNAILEAFTIHVRQLIDFLWKKARRGGENPDALASDFFAEGEWEELCPERPEILNDAIQRKIGWGVAHLTYGRAWVKPEEKQWEFWAIARALAPALIAFLDNVDPEKLVPAEVERMKKWAEDFGGREGGISAMRYLSAKT